MKKLVILVLIIMLFAGVFAVSAQEIPPEILSTLVGAMEADFALLLEGLGTDIDTVLLQNAMAGQNIGMAELGDGWFSTLYIGLPAISLTASNGFMTFRNEEDYFELLDLNTMLNDLALGGLYEAAGAENAQYVDLLLDQAFPFPAVKLNLGFKLPANLELLVNGMYIPPAVLGLIPAELPAGIEFSYINAGGVLRYILLRDSDLTPGFSIGLGGYYNNLHIGMGLGEMLGGMMPVEGDNPFEGAGMSIGTKTLAFGLDVAMSQRVLGIFVPYIKLGAWYAITETGGSAVLMTDDAATAENEEVSLGSTTGHNDLDLLLDSGFDITLGPFIMNLGGNYNLGSGVWGINLGSRLQF